MTGDGASAVPGPAAWDDGSLPLERLRPDTLAVRGGQVRTGFAETSEALFLTQGHVDERAGDAEAAFAGKSDRFVYSRYGNPTVSMFEERLRLLEGAEACCATSPGMSSVFTALAALVKAGDRIVAALRARDWGTSGTCLIIGARTARVVLDDRCASGAQRKRRAPRIGAARSTKDPAIFTAPWA